MSEVVVEAISDSDGRRERCTAIPTHRRPVAFEFGWIGSTEAELHSKLGKPSESRDNWQSFYFLGKAALPSQPAGSAELHYEVRAYVEAKLDGGKVTSIRAWIPLRTEFRVRGPEG
jgi:hypothetical protein